MSSPTPTKCPFPDVRRVVTGHTPTGKSTVLADTIQPPTSWSPDSVNPKFDLYYTGSAPASIDSEITQGKWVDEIADHPEILSADGSTFRAFEFAPGSFSVSIVSLAVFCIQGRLTNISLSHFIALCRSITGSSPKGPLCSSWRMASG
jgi:hypothetical protein